MQSRQIMKVLRNTSNIVYVYACVAIYSYTYKQNIHKDKQMCYIYSYVLYLTQDGEAIVGRQRSGAECLHSCVP